MDARKIAKQLVNHAEAFHQDRIGELRAQVPHGNPFVFLNAMVMLQSVGFYTGKGIYNAQRMLNAISPMYQLLDLDAALESISDGGLGMGGTCSLTHDEEAHLTLRKNRITISANAFLTDCSTAISMMFEDANPAEVVTALIEKPLIAVEEEDIAPIPAAFESLDEVCCPTECCEEPDADCCEEEQCCDPVRSAEELLAIAQDSFSRSCCQE